MFEIGSLTKTFTACLVFELATEGRLDINMPVGSYLEDLPVEWRRRSLATLLSHTSGLPEYLDASNFRALMPMALTPRGIVDIAAKRPILFSAGKEYAYNNTGYVLLGMVAEAVGKASFWQQLRARFFEPTGMNRTGPRGLINSDGDLATGHFWDGAQWDNSPPITAPGSTFSAGGLLSTSRDLARWAVALDEGRVVGSKARQKMWSRAILADGRPIDWGYGWKIEGEGDQRVVAHGGGTAGFSCWLSRDLATETTTFVLTNQNGRADPAVMASALQAASEKLLGR
jgi:CubicO group peptidase (beta-lactamase class C family)